MAIGRESFNGEIVESSISVRAGMKREFAMMIKAKEGCGLIMGAHRRVTRSQNYAFIDKNCDKGFKGLNKSEVSEQRKKVEAEQVWLNNEKEEIKSNIVYGNSDHEVVVILEKQGSNMKKIVDNQYVEKEALINKETKDRIEEWMNDDLVEIREQKRVKNIDSDCGAEEALAASYVGADAGWANGVPGKTNFRQFTYSIKLKDLFETGLLEGLPVHYFHGSRAIEPGEIGLRGEIQGSRILCFCDDCKGTRVLSPNQFLFHAGCGNMNASQYIYLKNGKSLGDIFHVFKNASSDSWEHAIQNAICWSQAKGSKGSIPQGRPDGSIRRDSCVALIESKCQTTQSTDTSVRPSLPVCCKKSSSKTSFSSHPKIKGQGKLTKKDLRLHKVVFESNLLADGTPLGYYIQGKQLLSGYKLGSGIFCHCCNKVVSPSLFEAHAGCASRRKPYLQIYTSEGVSLHEWALAIKRNWQSSTSSSDDVCSICEGTGELLCCDMCPRAFHKGCVNLPSIPEGTWYCRYCVNMLEKESFVERNANAVAAGRVAGIDPVEEVKKRCIRIIGAFEPEFGGCFLCRAHDFSESGFGHRTVIICDQCEKEYHVGCLKENGMDDLKELPNGPWFCCSGCSSIHSALQQLVNDGEKKLPEFLLNIIKKKHEIKASEDTDLNISWRLLHGKMASQESREWLSSAVSVFHERFDPIGDSNKNDDLIPFMIYGKNNRDQDFGGMYCAILMVNSTVVSAGIFRIFGQEVAEIPLVATSNSSQGKGYFQSLFGCIENLLASIKVRDMVLPAAHDAESMWKEKFGFRKMSAELLKQYKKDYQMMLFLGTSILHKTVDKLSEGNMVVVLRREKEGRDKRGLMGLWMEYEERRGGKGSMGQRCFRGEEQR
ncbi:hypothetical protein ACH5RR_032266 [Cinchona calisaya]|uniref:PHD-type domain-containing protein n=1 Tax=Cinchona calisaya TaxID=153742 RepID=A0ABD2YK85_9GENT